MSKLLEHLKKFVGNDILLLYGETGSLKSKLCMHVFRSVLEAGGSALYIDTEGDQRNHMGSLGKFYRYSPIWEEFAEIINRAPKYDLMVLDSIGLPVLIQWARANTKGRGDAMLKGIALLSRAKEWAYKNDSLFIATTQPQSDFGDAEEGRIKGANDPVGGKALFVAKEIWYSRLDKTNATLTEATVLAHRSRVVGTGAPILTIQATPQGLQVTPVKGIQFYRDRGEAPEAPANGNSQAQAAAAPVETPREEPSQAPATADQAPTAAVEPPHQAPVDPPPAPSSTGGNGHIAASQKRAILAIVRQKGITGAEYAPDVLDALTFEEASEVIQSLQNGQPKAAPIAAKEAPPAPAVKPAAVVPPPAQFAAAAPADFSDVEIRI